MVTGQELLASLRARGAVPSPMRKLTPLAEQAAAAGAHIYHLNIGQPDLAAPESVLDSIHEYDSDLLPYAPSHGLPETLEAWQEYYANIGITLSPDELLVTAGGSEAVLFAMLAVADPGDEVIAFEPAYANYFGFAKMAGIEVVTVTASAREGYHLPASAEIEAAITTRTRAIIITTPGNPTGAVYGYAELERLSDIVSRHGLFVISDETYREIVFSGPRDMSMLKVAGAAGQTIVVDSLSKRFSVTGARIGCLASHHPGVMSGAMRFAQARLSVATVEQRAMIGQLKQSREYTDKLADVYRRRRDVVYGRLTAMAGVQVREPEGAFYILPTLPIDDAERFARWLLADFRLDGETLMVAPGDGFYLTPHLGKHEVRLAFILEERALERAMDLLEAALLRYPGAEGTHVN